jgi:hypothetical protein
MLLLVFSVGSVLRSQTKEQNAAPEQQTPPASQGPSSKAAVQSVTGCVVKSDQGYSLKTQNDTYPIETDQDLSQYVNKQVKVTAIAEHHSAPAPSPTAGSSATVTDLRLRTVVSVVGDCDQAPK